MEEYDSLEDALYYAAQAARDSGGGVNEVMTAIYQRPNGKYGYVPPVSSRERTHVKATLRYPASAKLVHLLHTHPAIAQGMGELPGDPHGNEFSKDDLDTARRLGLPSAIVYGSDMRIKTYDPTKPDQAPRDFDYIPEIHPTAKKIGPEILQQLAARLSASPPT